MSQPNSDATLDQLCINTLRILSAEGVQKANSGHPGLPMGAASLAYVLWTRFLRHNPADPAWPNRDRFVLSAGHGSMLLYSLLHLTGYDLPLSELQNFRQWGSRTPGHPEAGLTPGVEATTGPLGQGFANGVGMALAERFLAAFFNRPGFDIVDHFTYALVSDGDLMEGISHEAASLAGHLKLGKLIYLYDDNRISIEGSTDLTFSEDRAARFAAYGWHVQEVDGLDLAALTSAIQAAQANNAQPSLILCRTTIGFGSPNRAGTAGVHGEPLGAEELRKTKENLGWPLEPPFYLPDAARAHFGQAQRSGAAAETAWRQQFADYAQAYPTLAQQWDDAWSGTLPAGWDEGLPVFAASSKGMATRNASGEVINALAARLPMLIGGSADLAPSTKTLIKGGGDFSATQPHGRNVRFGVRELGMGGLLNGLALHGGVLPYGATFLVFSDYIRPTMRVAALSHLHVIYVFTHDSIGLGEDGPTHQPVEQLAALRVIPGLTVIRPADANETIVAWQMAIQAHGPVALILTRQNVPTLDRATLAPAAGLQRGAYILADAPGGQPQVILLASGSEVSLALEAQQRLAAQGVGVRVVNMGSWEIFARQDEAYRQQVLPPEVTARVGIEAGVTLGWERWLGAHGVMLGIDRFGASAPYERIYHEFGLTADAIVAAAENLTGL